VLECDPEDLEWDEQGRPVDQASAFFEVGMSPTAWLTRWLASPTRAERAVAEEAEMLADAGDLPEP
jgi:hypothetical protein